MRIVQPAISEIPDEIAALWVEAGAAIKQVIAKHVFGGGVPRDILVIISASGTELAGLMIRYFPSEVVLGGDAGDPVVAVLDPVRAKVFIDELEPVEKVVATLPDDGVPILVFPAEGNAGMCSCRVIDRRTTN